MSYRSGRYNSFGKWTVATAPRTSGPVDPALRNSPAMGEAMAKIDRAFGKAGRPQ